VAHTALVALLRGDSRLDSSDGELTIGVLPVVIVGLERLQEVGLIPDDVELPDPSDAEASTAIREVITDRLGIDIPPDFGEVPIVRMSRLETARQLVTIFDFITVASLVVAAVLAALTIWLARNRRRAVIRLGFGTAAAVVVVQLLALILSQVVADSMARETPILAAIVGALISNLALALTVVLVLAIGVALATMVVSRRAQPAG
jgi:predicted lysophospholipase L1 biosynthesis ABC-type transport system permease subunit